MRSKPRKVFHALGLVHPHVQCSATREEMDEETVADLVTMAMCMLLSFTMHLNGSEEPLENKMLAWEEAGKHALIVFF